MNKNRTVTPTELQVIQKTAADVSVHPYIRRRALILQEVFNSTGTDRVIAARLGVPVSSVEKVVRAFSTKKLGVFTSQLYPQHVQIKEYKHEAVLIKSKAVANLITKHKQ